MRKRKPWLGALALVALWPATNASAFKFAAGSMNSWSSCEASCKPSSLSNCDDQVRGFIDEMQSAGHTSDHWYANDDVWSSDLVEDSLGGDDYFYTDPYIVYIYSGHGSAYNDSAGLQKYSAPMCHNSSGGDCNIRSTKTRLGERTGPYAASTGNIRWLVLCTCYSVHTEPGQQWGDQFYYGTDIVFGYRGVSADSSTTDEVPADFASASFSGSDKFKAGWFWAIEDWWVDDVGSLVGSGTSTADANDRRDNMTKSWARRPNTELHAYRAWSWHEG